MRWSSPRYDSIKRNLEKHTEIFLEFLVFLNKQNKREKQKREKLFTRESSQQAKEELGNHVGNDKSRTFGF